MRGDRFLGIPGIPSTPETFIFSKRRNTMRKSRFTLIELLVETTCFWRDLSRCQGMKDERGEMKLKTISAVREPGRFLMGWAFLSPQNVSLNGNSAVLKRIARTNSDAGIKENYHENKTSERAEIMTKKRDVFKFSSFISHNSSLKQFTLIELLVIS